jgi:hypothetical protein
MKRLLLPIAFLATVQLACAGLVIVEDLERTGGPTPGKDQLTITVSGEKNRMDIGKNISTIIDSKTGSTVALMHDLKMVMEVPAAIFDAIKKAGASAKEDSKLDLKPTGKKQTINGFACEEYAGKLKKMNVTFWVTNEIENQKEILDQLSKLQGDGDPFKGALADGKDFPGVPIRTIFKTNELGTTTMTITSIKNEEVPDSVFEIPADYKKMEMPQMQIPGGGAPAIPAIPEAQ